MAMGHVPEHDETGGDAGFVDINITPLTDIFLVLLIIFMVTSTVIVREGAADAGAAMGVRLPSGASADVRRTQADVVLTVLSDGRTLLAGKELAGEQLRAALVDVATKAPGTTVVLQADESVPHGTIVALMELTKEAGLGQLAIGVRAEPGGKGGR